MSDTAADDTTVESSRESIQVSSDNSTDIIEANRRIVALTRELKNASARLKAASAARVASDKNLLKRTGELKSAEGDLVASDKNLLERTGELKMAVGDLVASDTNLMEANEQLEVLIDELAVANGKLLRASEQIRNNEKMQTEFINIAAHELRTPIQPIIGILDLYGVNTLAATIGNEAEEGKVSVEREHLRLVARNADRLARLSSDILDATRIESKNLKLSIDKNVDLIRLVSYAVEDAKSKVANGNIEFLVDFPEEGLEADVDSYRLLQVLANLLDNAIKFTAKGRISITVREANSVNGYVEIIVSDSGKGIDSKIVPRLFQKFSSNTDIGSGTGLGLYISKAIVEAHGGRIRAENNKNTKGSTFAFTLRRAANS